MSILSNYIHISISLPQLGNDWISGLCAEICEAGRTVSYIETVSRKADSLHKCIPSSSMRELRRAYEIQARLAIQRLGLNEVELAVDGSQDLFYGKLAGFSVRQIKHEHGADEAWEYIVISTVWPVRLPLMAIPYPQGADKAQLVIELLEYARNLPLKIRNILFDRGFYNAHLIDYLESAREGKPLPYLILAPQNDSNKSYIEVTDSEFGFFRHQMNYNLDKSSWKPHTTIVVCKNAGYNEKGEPYHCLFATNLRPSLKLLEDYRRRWNIETGFRVMKEGKIRSKSVNPLVRFFYFLIRMLLCLIWLLNNVFRAPLTFKAFLGRVEHTIRLTLPIVKPPWPISPIF